MRPGTLVSSRTAPPPRGIASDTGKWFVVGTAQKGSLTEAKLVRNMTEFERLYGTRQSYSILWDSVDAFFREGGSEAYVARAAGAAAVSAGRAFNDSGAAASLRIDAKNPGSWGNSLSVEVSAGTSAGEFILTVTHLTYGTVDRSPSLIDVAGAVAWGRVSDWVTITATGVNDPAVIAASALSGGVDDNNPTDTQRVTAMGLFTKDLGPGQVSMPGNLTGSNRSALKTHARANNRLALLDATDTAVTSTLATEAQGLWGDEYAAMFAPWVIVPGTVLGSGNRTVPPSAIAAGLMARNDSTYSPNVPAAGANGVADYAIGLTQSAFSDADYEALNNAGVNAFRDRRGAVRLYGYRTLVRPNGDVSWQNMGNQRLRLKITAEAEEIAEAFIFGQIDGRGHKIAQFGGALTGMLNSYYVAGSLYGDTSDEAFAVDVGPAVNTPATIGNGELHAVLTLKMAPFAELLVIEIVKVSVTEEI